MAILRPVLLKASQNEWLKRRLPRQAFARRAVRRFMPGERLEDALTAAAVFADTGIGTVITALGENVTTQEDAATVAEHYEGAISAVAAAGLDCEISVKPTHLGLDLGATVAEEGIRRLLDAAERHGNFVWIDMESSAYTGATLDLYTAAREASPRVGVCLQANLRRTPTDLERLAPLRPSIRLVKGAYLEPEPLAFALRSEVDTAYARLAERLLDMVAGREPGEVGLRAAIATHDVALIDRIRRTASERGVRGGYEFQMLYGIRKETQRRLASEGQPIRVLISYGEQWFPWYMRRLAERPANVMFLLRSLVAR